MRKATKLSYTQRVERYWARIFLDLYNRRFNTNYRICRPNRRHDNPDITALDKIAGQKLGLEIKRHSSIPEDLQIDQMSFSNSSINLRNTFGQRGNIDNIVDQLQLIIDDERKSTKFHDPVALVIPTVFNPWTPREILMFRGDRLRTIAIGMKDHYPAGVWFFCSGKSDLSYELLDLTDL